MTKKVMVIGLGPEYNYNTRDHSMWSKNNTRYASNHGASLISRSLLMYFNADYVDDLDNPEKYKNKYELCVLAFATHITTRRDVSPYTKFVKKLGIKTVAFSLGIQDYSSSTTQVNVIHPSMKELLEYVLSTSGYIGVRGSHTASVLIKSGFRSKNIIRIGCPTTFKPLNRNLQIDKKKKFSNPLIVFHRSMGGLNKKILTSAPLMGQDFLDEAIFTENLPDDNPVVINEQREFNKLKNGELARNRIAECGIFYHTFKEWFDEIGKHDFVFGARLHGCIAALIQGIPAVMIARDIRVIEIAEFYRIPYIKYDDIGEMSIEDIYEWADYTEFNNLYKYRFDNFVKLLKDLDVLKDTIIDESTKVPETYVFNEDDININNEIIFGEIASMQLDLSELSKKMRIVDDRLNMIKNIPGIKTLSKLIR